MTKKFDLYISIVGWYICHCRHLHPRLIKVNESNEPFSAIRYNINYGNTKF